MSKGWMKRKKQEPKEIDFIISHALRTLVKQGDEEALAMLGYVKNPPMEIKNFHLQTPCVQIGEALEFEVEIVALDDVKLMVDYVMHFQTKVGKLSPKVHKFKKLELKKGEKIILTKKHLFRANMSTRTLYAGNHLLELQINGKIVHSENFELKI